MSSEQVETSEATDSKSGESEPVNGETHLQPAFREISLLDLPRSQRPWKRLPDESAVAYFAFTKYLEMGPGTRSHELVAEIFPRSKTQIHNYSTQYDWVERAKWYDDYMAELAQRELETAVSDRMKENAALWAERAERIRENAYQVSLDLLATASQMLEVPLFEDIDISAEGDEHKTIIRKPTNWRMRDAKSFIEAAVRLQYLAAEMGGNGNNGRGNFDPKKATDEQLQAIVEGRNPTT